MNIQKLFLLMTVMLLLFIGGAMALSTDAPDAHVMGFGDTKKAFFVMSVDDDAAVEISAQENGFISVSKDIRTLGEGVFLVPYTVSTPYAAKTGVYNQTIYLDSGGEIVKFPVNIRVYRPLVANSILLLTTHINFLGGKVPLYWVFLSVLAVAIILYSLLLVVRML